MQEKAVLDSLTQDAVPTVAAITALLTPELVYAANALYPSAPITAGRPPELDLLQRRRQLLRLAVYAEEGESS
jgi:hypothetical protein